MQIGIDIEPINKSKEGIGFYVQNLVEGLARIDHHNSYFLYSRQDPKLNLPGNFQIVTIKTREPFWHWGVIRDVRKKNISIYHSTHSYQPALFIKKGLVLTIHDLSSLTHPEWHSLKVRLLGKLLPFAARRAWRIIVPSHSIANELKDKLDLNKGKLAVTYEAASDVYKQSSHLRNDNVLFIGTLEPRKNLVRLIKAYSTLTDLPGKLVIAGKKGWYYQEIFDSVKKYGLQDRVQFLGYVSEEEKIKLFQTSKIFVFPSLYEGFGLPVMEAMKSGIPVVTSSGGALEEITSGAAVLSDPTVTDQIARNIRRLYDDKKLYLSAQEQGLSRSKDFNWDQTAKQTLQIYESN